MIRELAFFVLGITAVIFLVVAGLGVYALIRFRRRRGDDGREPPQVYGSQQIELAWTVVPLLIVVVLFLVTARYIYGIERRAPPADALEVTIVGHQWWWEIRYPKLGIVTANELHVPVSDAARPDADLHHAPVRGRDPQLLDPPARREDGRDSEQDEPRVDRSTASRARTLASARSTADSSTPACS